jgi:hypothetical protein
MMKRGNRSIFNSLFQDENVSVEVVPPERKGRSPLLLKKQNEKLVHRYYFYIKIVRKQYQDTLAILEDEFTLSQRTIVNIISQEHVMLRALNGDKPESKYFKSKYPYLVWN